MNRILLEDSIASKALPTSQITNSTDTDTIASDPSGFTVLAPLHYERNYAYPLLVWLHAEGENESSIKNVMPQISMRNYVAIAPRGTRELPAAGDQDFLPGFTWRQSEEDIFVAQQRILGAIEEADKRFNVHRRRVFLAGASCGGTMAFRIAMSYPERFAGVISLGGAFPRRHAPLVRLMEARRLPVFIGAGRESSVYGQNLICDNLRLFHTAGMCVTLRLYPGSEDASKLALTDVDRWIMEVISEDQESAVVTK